MNNFRKSVRNHFTLEIHLFVMNFNSVCVCVGGGFFQGTILCRSDTVLWILAMGLADLSGIGDLHCRKVEST